MMSKWQTVTCATCGKEFQKRTCRIKRTTQNFCSYECNGVRRGQEWKTYGHLGRAAWTPETEAAYRQKITGENNPDWKGGVTYFRKKGNYKMVKYVRCPKAYLPMARKDGYVMEHRLLMAIALGRCLMRVEVVHHRNHDPKDNRIENLELFPNNQAHKLAEGVYARSVAASWTTKDTVLP